MITALSPYTRTSTESQSTGSYDIRLRTKSSHSARCNTPPRNVSLHAVVGAEVLEGREVAFGVGAPGRTSQFFQHGRIIGRRRGVRFSGLCCGHTGKR